MSSYYLEQDGKRGPLCPYTGGVQNERHRAWVGIQNLAYDRVKHLYVDGELPKEGEVEHQRIIREEALRFDITVPDGLFASYDMEAMQLYVSGATVSYTAQTERGTNVEAFYFQCRVCGFVLPANRIRQ